MAGAQFTGGPTSARDTDAGRDDAIRADPKLLQFWKDSYQDWSGKNGGGDSATGFAHADKMLDQEIARRKESGPKRSRAQKRYSASPSSAVNDNEAE